MRCWHDLDLACGQIKTAVCAACDHAFEFLAHKVRPEVRHRDEHAFLLRVVVLAHFRVDTAADNITGGPFAFAVIVEHEPLTRMADKLPACPAKAFFQHCSGHAGMVARQQSCGVELHHFHVAQFEACAQRHGQPVHCLVAGGRVVFVHGRPAAGAHQHRFGPHQPEPPRPHVDHQNARQSRPVFRRNKPYCAVLLQFFDPACEHLFHQPVDDFDACQIAFVHRPICGLSCEGFLVQ